MTFERTVAAGKTFYAPEGSSCAITGDQLRKCLLSEKITAAGITMDGGPEQAITIKAGRDEQNGIDLSYLAGSDGAPLPPLIIRNAVIASDLRLTGTHFTFLSISNCKIKRIDGDHCQVDNHCRLSDLSAAEPAAGEAMVAQIRLVAARIDGTADFRGCSLRAPPPDHSDAPPPRNYANRYALSLASAEIAGRLLLDDRFSALGGVSLYQSVIRNSVSLRTARLESCDPDVPALDAEEMRLSSSFLWSNPPESNGVEDDAAWDIAGRVVFERAEIGGNCTFENCRWASRGSESLNGGLVNHIAGGIDLRLSRIQGQLHICRGCYVSRANATPARRAEEDVRSGMFGPSIDGWKAYIGKGVRIEDGAEFTGPIFLNGSRIEHDFLMRGKIQLPIPRVGVRRVPEAIDLSAARVGGFVRMWCEVSGAVVLRSATIEGAVELQRLDFRCPWLIPANEEEDRKSGQATILDLSFAAISGTLHIGTLTLSWPSRIAQPLEALFRPGIPLRAVGYEKRAVGVTSAHRYFLSQGMQVTVGFTTHGPRLLEGRVAEFTEFLDVSEYPITSMDAESLCRSYVHRVVGELGPVTQFALGRITKPEREWVIADCKFAYGGYWYGADLRIAPDCTLQVLRERQLACKDPIAPPAHYRVGPFLISRTTPPPAPANRLGPEAEFALRSALEGYVRDRSLRPVLVDFRGLHCQAFDDDDARAWLPLGNQRWWRLLLDGISFSQFICTSPKHRSRHSDSSAPGTASAADSVDLEGATQPVACANTFGNLTRVWASLKTLISPPLDMEAERRNAMLLSFTDRTRIDGWSKLASAARHPEFSPQPFEVFARGYLISGERAIGIGIATLRARLYWTKLWLEVRDRIDARRTKTLLLAYFFAFMFVFLTALAFDLPRGGADVILGMFALAPLVTLLLVATASPMLRWVGRTFEFTFGFGLKPRRAALTLLACLVAGAVVANLADQQLLPLAESGAKVTAADGRLPQTNAREIAVEGCNLAADTVVDRSLYAFDVFVPLIDVRQECSFYFERDAKWLRFAKTFYAALGWVVLSLTILTFSGVLRRDIESP